MIDAIDPGYDKRGSNLCEMLIAVGSNHIPVCSHDKKQRAGSVGKKSVKAQTELIVASIPAGIESRVSARCQLEGSPGIDWFSKWLQLR